MSYVERVKTGIPGFDDLIEGGFPRDATIVLAGGPGTGKTIFGLQFLYNGALQGEKGLYVTFEQSRFSLVKQAIQFGWNLIELEEKKLLYFFDIPPSDLAHGTIDEIKKLANDEGIKRIVIDSLTTLAINAPILTNMNNVSVKQVMEQSTIFSPPIVGDFVLKQFIYSFISKMSRIPATSILVSDTASIGDYNTIDTVSEYTADGVVLINFETLGGAYSRTLIVRKMRQTKNDEDIHPLEIGKEGIVVHTIK